MSRPRLFLSAVSEELRSARQAVAVTVRTLGFDPVSQDDFPTGYGELRQWLREQLDSCEGLIQLVGQGYGAEPPAVDPEYGRVSYTQFEFLYARHQGKKIWVIVVGEGCHRDKPPEQLDLPRDSSHPDPAGYQAERRQLQQDYLARLKRENHLRHTANNDTELDNIVLRLRDELGELRKRWEEWLQKDADFKARSTARLDELSEAARLTTEKIRAHLLQTTEETHRRELAEAGAATDWKQRQRLRDAADAANAARLSRIEELAASFAEIEGRGTATNVFQEMTRILTEQGVDEAIAYVGTQQSAIFQNVRARAAAAHERNRADLQPLLQAAALHDAKGQAAEARALYTDIVAAEPDWPEALHAAFWFLTAQGDGARVRSTLADGRRDYEEAHRIAQRLTVADPANTEWRRDLSVSHERIGNVLRAQGDSAGALAAYRTSLAIAERLAATDPANAESQRDLSVSHERIGNVLVAQGDGAGALAAYRTSLAIRERLAATYPANTECQRDLSISHEKIGDMLVAQGDGAGALAAYRTSLAIAERLVATDSAHSGWQRDLSVSHERIGEMLIAQGDGAGALAACRTSLTIAERLAATDPANTEWQGVLSVSHDRIGDVLVAQGDGAGALAACRTSLAIRERVTATDSANTKWQCALAASHQRIGEMLIAQGDGAGALAACRTSLAIAERLAATDPANTERQGVLWIFSWGLADLAERQNETVEARRYWKQALDVLSGIEEGASTYRRTNGKRWKSSARRSAALRADPREDSGDCSLPCSAPAGGEHSSCSQSVALHGCHCRRPHDALLSGACPPSPNSARSPAPSTPAPPRSTTTGRPSFARDLLARCRDDLAVILASTEPDIEALLDGVDIESFEQLRALVRPQ